MVLTQTLKPLPDDVMMTMKLLYYDDGTIVPLTQCSFQLQPFSIHMQSLLKIMSPQGFEPLL